MNKETDLIHSIHIELPKYLQERVIKEYKKVSKDFKDLRTHEFKMQISVYSAYISTDSTDKFIENALRCLSGKKFKITFSEYSFKDNGAGSGYIFIDLDSKSSKKVSNLNSDIKKAMKSLESDSFRDYPFEAHLSLTKLVTAELNKAYDSLDCEGILNQTFEVSEILLSRQVSSEDWDNVFPVIRRIKLL